MKQSVATIERCDSRAMPQMPCPLVQPEPMREPKPTSRPASAMIQRLPVNFGTSIVRESPSTSGGTRSPAMNQSRQPVSPERGCSRPPAMPLTPRMRPFRSSSAAAATPISRPPSRAVTGVKLVQSMFSMRGSLCVIASEAKQSSCAPAGALNGRAEFAS
jgi:hypothetical protein